VPSTARRDGTRQKPSVSLKDQLLKEYLNKRNLAEKKKRENPAEYYEILKKNAQPLKRFENEMRLQCAKFDYKQSLR
jgi:hypothetical protein